MLYREPTDLHLSSWEFFDIELISLSFQLTRIFSVLFIKPFTKNYRTISKLIGIFNPKVNSIFCFMMCYSKTKRYLYLQKKMKKRRDE